MLIVERVVLILVLTCSSRYSYDAYIQCMYMHIVGDTETTTISTAQFKIMTRKKVKKQLSEINCTVVYGQSVTHQPTSL